MDKLVEFFTEDGYLAADEEQRGEIPARLEGIAKLQKSVLSAYKEFAKGIDKLCEKYEFLQVVP